MDNHDSRTIEQREACAIHAHLQWAIYALPRRHPARAMLMLATAKADRDRQASLRPAEDDERQTGATAGVRHPALASR